VRASAQTRDRKCWLLLAKGLPVERITLANRACTVELALDIEL